MRKALISEALTASQPVAVALVHGVRRIPGGTVLYYSLGYPPITRGWVRFSWLSESGLPEDNFGISSWGVAKLLDVTNHKAYGALKVQEKGKVLASPEATSTQEVPGKFWVLFEVMPELPIDVKTVDVRFGPGEIIQNVPVEDGLLTPAVPADHPIELGTGWPAIDLTAVAAAWQPQSSIYPIATSVSDIKQTITTVQKPQQESVDLDSNVLFAVDQATLTPTAQATLQQAADIVNKRASSGVVKIIGYTDDTGTASHNLDLSRRRAQAVVAALTPLISVAGVSFTVDGRGEADPVASNDTPAGRQRNRRVSIIFTPKAG